MVDLAAAEKEMRRLSKLVDNGVDKLRDQAREYAQAEHDYRLAVARAWIEAPRDHDDRRITVPEREAWVHAATAVQRMRRDEAEGVRQAALEAVRSRRGQLSAWQSLLAAHREEAGMASYGPEAGQ